MAFMRILVATQTKARADGLHENFGCYNFAYHKDMKTPVVSYRTKWPTGWKNEWFYVKADEKKREKLKTLVLARPVGKVSGSMLRTMRRRGRS